MVNSANHSRLISMTYPNGRVLNYNYNSGLDTSLSRLSSISDSSVGLEAYTYLGLGTVVKRAHPRLGIDQTYIAQSGQPNGDAGDQYIGLDRFGRVVDQRWLVAATGVATDEFTYGYDRNSNRLYRDNKVNSAFGELYHANGAANGYDNLGRLTAFARGTLSISSGHTVPDTIAGTPAANESWSLDALGNWTSFTTGTTTQTRTANQQNEITSISGATTTPVYDLNGNMKTDQTGNTLFYDAWNRLVRVMSGPTVLELYTYDALGRRVMENPSGTLPKSLYYSSAWQVLEERWSGATQVQYVWSPVYVDAMIERDRGSERFYVQQDANWNVTAIVNATTGVVQERYVYDPYGQPTILDPTTPSWNTRSASSFAWVYLHQGGRYDTGTGLYTFRNRDYSPTLGRWVQNDPLALAGGDTNLYRYAGDQPLGALDPSGLQPLFPPGNPAASVEWIWKKIRTWFRPGPSGTPAQLAPISRVGEISTDSTGKPLGSFTTHPEVTTAPGKPTCILSVVFHRGYFLMDRNSNPIQSSGIKIYERVFVHANTANFPVTANSVPTTNGQFMDSPGVGEGSNKPLPDSFDLFVTRIFYLKTGQANSPVIILGANDYRITRDAGDDATAVKNKSYMNAMYYPSGFSPAPGVPKGAQPDSGF